jgi:hypothetical protein
MDLHLLRETSNIAVYYDADNDWLFVDWRGVLTLPLTQECCLLLAECLLDRPYTRILNSNQNVTDFTRNVPNWLHTEFLPLLRHTSIEYLAWVYSPNMLLNPFIDKLVAKVEVPVVNLFDDVELAASWLLHTRFHYLSNAPKPCNATKHCELVKHAQAMADGLGRPLHYTQPYLMPSLRKTA